ncbi:MAG: hypothetical protein AVO35_13100 [Candidatus Aegiribacteria sp. MLS_C]|nr:MAG: hypothetical protein AVO35_13100 [Candidatus Aegiribacteria sp. MLS_C]
MSVFIIRAFVKLREIALTNETLSKKFRVLEDRVTEHDTILMSIIKEIQNLIDSPRNNEKTRIGFRIPEKTEEKMDDNQMQQNSLRGIQSIVIVVC